MILISVFSVIAGMLAIYIALSPRVGERIYRPLLFEPHGFSAESYTNQFIKEHKPEECFITIANGHRLHGWYFFNERAEKTILVCHGNTGNISDLDKLIALLLAANASVFVFDYQGYGKSTGSPSVKGIGEDALAVYDWLITDKHIRTTNIVLYGESLGAAVACQLAQQLPVCGLILQSAFCDLRRISLETFPPFVIYPSSLFPQPYFDNARAVQNCPCPLLLIHGLKDREINSNHARELFAKASQPKELILLSNTGHEEIADLDSDLFSKAITTFLLCCMPASSPL